MTARPGLPQQCDLGGGGWTVEVAGGDGAACVAGRAVPARVPGCVHLDLIRAGLIEHPDRGDAESACRWIGRTDWRYATVLPAVPGAGAHERLDLVCRGLDTIATVSVDDRAVGTAANMHHPHRFDVRAHARGGGRLDVVFRGPLAYVEAQEARLGARPVNGDWGPYVFARTAACTFGWDWGPQCPSAGIWRTIELHAWTGARIQHVRPLVRSIDAALARVEVCVDLAWADAWSTVTVRATLDGPGSPTLVADARVDAGTATVVLPLEVRDPRRWWPRGHGGQPRYALDVRVLGPGGVEADRATCRIGLRTAHLEATADADGRPFTFVVNDEPVFCAGANWIPDGLFPAGVDAARRGRRIGQAVAANMNMLRVWGGGIYEEDDFYDACDEQGVLVWQDFMFACATYPEDPPYPALIETEARHQVARLAAHPSVVLWCGGNENTIAYEGWGFREALGPDRAWGRTYWFQQLPRIVAELDPTRPYWPDSPYAGDGRPPNDPDRGDRHTWDARVEGYRDLVPRFLSEFGHQSPPARAAWRDAVGAEGCSLDAPALHARQRGGGGCAGQYDGPIAARFRRPASFDDWHYLAQLLQARAMSIAMEWCRVNAPRCMGALLWQLNDVWTGHSWSVIDVTERPKPAWYAVRRALAPRLLALHPVDGSVHLFAVNDTGEAWDATVRVRRMSFDGAERADDAVTLALPPRAARRLADVESRIGAPDDAAGELVFAEVDGGGGGGARATWFYRADRELRYPAPGFEATCARDGDGLVLRLEARTLLRDIVIAVDRLDSSAQIDEQLVTLLPGEAHAFRIRSDRPLDAAALTAPAVMACANRHGA